jgi:signal transduction histidine kinase
MAATGVPTDAEIITAVADDLPVGVWVARVPGGEFVYANRMFAEIMGQAGRDDVAVGGYAEPYGIYDRQGRLYPEDRMPFVRAIEARATVVVDDIVIHRGDGRRVNVRAHARPLFRGETITHVVIAFFDISREVAAERSRDDFISAASHELKTPIGALQIRAQTMLRLLERGETLGAEQMLEWTAHAERQVRRLARLSEALLDVSRIRAGRIELKREPVDLARLVRAAADRIADDLAGACPQLIVEAPETLLGTGDALRIDQVLTNLLSNAAKYGEGRPVELALRHDGAIARIEVRDRGLGIASEDQARIFSPFERAVSSTSTGGLGLGLWIVHEIVARMNGRIQLDSSPGIGSCVTVEIPWPK